MGWETSNVYGVLSEDLSSKTNDNSCPRCKIGQIVIYTKPDGNHYGCNNCFYEEKMRLMTKQKEK